MRLIYAVVGSVIGAILLFTAFAFLPAETPAAAFAAVPAAAILVAWYFAEKNKAK